MVTNIDQLNKWKQDVYPAIVSKAEEFHLMGYEAATAEEVWDCLLAKLERKKETYRLHQFISEIFRLSVNEYMNWLTIRAYTGPDLLKENRTLLGFDE